MNYTRDCNKNGSPGCVVSAIKNMTHILLEEGEERSRDGERTKEALMFLIHFLGDIHQPLHTEHLNVGGNTIKVCFDADCSKNLHSVWDTSIPTKYRGLSHNFTHLEEKAAAKLWADEIYEADTTTPSTRTLEKEQNESTDVKDPQSCALQWAVESNGFVCSYVLKPGVEWLELNDLGGSYYEGAALIVEARIAAAGKRLGGWINGIVEELSAERQKLLVQKEL